MPPSPPAIVQKSDGANLRPKDYYRHPGGLQGLQSPRVPTVPSPDRFVSPEGQIQLTLTRLSEAKVPTNLLQRVEARLQDWAKGEGVVPSISPRYLSDTKKVAIKELATLDPGFVLTNRDSLGAATIGSVAVAKIAAYELGALDRLNEVTASLLTHPAAVSSSEAALASSKILPYGGVGAPPAVVSKVGGWVSESLNAEVIAEGLLGFISTHANAPRALGEQILTIPTERRLGVFFHLKGGFLPELLQALGEDPLKGDPVSREYIISRVKEAPKLALRSPVAEQLPYYASEAVYRLNPIALLELDGLRHHLSPRFTNELSRALSDARALYAMIPGRSDNLEALMKDQTLVAFQSSLRHVIDKVPGRAALLTNRFGGNLKAYLEQLPADRRKELVESGVRTSRLTSHIWRPGSASTERYEQALAMAQKAVKDIPIFEGRKVIVIANNEMLGDERTTGQTLKDRVYAFAEGLKTGDSHRFGKKGATQAIEKLSGRPVDLFRGKEGDSHLSLETVKTNALRAIVETPPGPNGLVVLFDTHGSANEQFLSNGTVNEKGEIVRGENPVTISMFELQQALAERSKRYPEAEGLRQRSIILISSCMSLKFAEDIAQGPVLATKFVPSFVAAAAERGQFGFSITDSPVGSDFLAHALRLGSCISDDGKVRQQPTLGDLDKIGPEAISNPALFAPYSIIRGLTGETNRLVGRASFQVY